MLSALAGGATILPDYPVLRIIFALTLCLVCGVLAGCQTARPLAAPDYATIRQELHRIRQRDQQIREALTAVGLESPAAGPLFKQMRGIDSVNQIYVRHLLTTTGWPARSQVGDTAAGAVFPVVQPASRA